MNKFLLGVLIGFGIGEAFNRWEKKVDKDETNDAPEINQVDLSEHPELKKSIDELDLTKIGISLKGSE